MPDTSPLLSLPFLLPAQAQKHVTHNEALDLLDLTVQLVVEAFAAMSPPTAPSPGETWAVGPLPTGDWSGQAGRLASWRNGAWIFVTPRAGWRAWGRSEGSLRLFDGSGWVATPLAADLQNLAGVGINTGSDTTNRLAVAADATLLTHAGAGHQLKLNKATATDTASLLFQTGWSGRAEMGLAGNDGFSIKVSADGLAFATALSTTPDGRVTLPGGARLTEGTAAQPGLAFAADDDTGLMRPAADQIALVTGGTQRMVVGTSSLQVNLPVTGSAAQGSATDATAGRLMKTGAFGLGAGSGVAAPSDDANLCVNAGIGYRFTAAGLNTPGTPLGGSLIVSTGTTGDIQQLFLNREGTRAWLRGWSSATSSWSGWQRLVSNEMILGTVSQVGGVPTGAVIETGSNANGIWTRFADGTMLCQRIDLSAANASTVDGALFRSGDVAWTFPAPFAAVPVVSGGADDADTWVAASAPTVSACVVRVKSTVSKASARTIRLMAQGRWF